MSGTFWLAVWVRFAATHGLLIFGYWTPTRMEQGEVLPRMEGADPD